MKQRTHASYQNRVTYLQSCRQFQIAPDEQLELPTHIPYGYTLTGRTVTTPLGEGLFDFCYADFTGMKQYSAQDCGDAFLLEPASVPFVATLYAALFPDQSRHTLSLQALQMQYLDLLRFCCDADYEPDVLGDLSAADRYALWCQIHDSPAEMICSEAVCAAQTQAREEQMPLNDAQRAFAERHGLTTEMMEDMLQQHRTIQRAYLCSSLGDMLRIEFMQMLEENVQVRKCRRCGKYFLVKGNYPSLYCTRTAEGSTQTCQQLAAASTFHSKVKDNDGDNAWGVYSKYYKRYYARIKRGALTAAEFKQWQQDAARMRDDCLDGKMTLDEYKNWLERYY